MMKFYEDYLVGFLYSIVNGNKKVILKNGRTYTCIEGKTRYAIGKGKEGKFITIKDVYEYLKGKKVESYHIIKDDSINLLSDDIKCLSYVIVPSEEEFNELKIQEELSIEHNIVDNDVKSWSKRLNRAISDGRYVVVGYSLKDSEIGYKDIVLDLVSNDGKTTMHMSCDNEYHVEELLKVVKPLIAVCDDDNTLCNDSVVCNTTDDGKFYIKTNSCAYEEVEGIKLINEYGFDLFYRKIACGNYNITHTPTGIALGGTITCNESELINKLQEMVDKHGVDGLVNMFKNAIKTQGTVPNYGINDSKNEDVSVCVESSVDDDYLYSDVNLYNVLNSIEKIKSFKNDSASEIHGHLGTSQGGYYRLTRCNNNNFHMTFTIKDYKSDDVNKYEKFGLIEDVVSGYVEFLSKHQLDYIKYLEMIGKDYVINDSKDTTMDSCVDNDGLKDDTSKISRFIGMNDKTKLSIVINALDMSFKKVTTYSIDSLCNSYCYMDGIMNHSFSCCIVMGSFVDDYKFKDLFEVALFNELKEHNLIIDDDNIRDTMYDILYCKVNRLSTKDYFDGVYHSAIGCCGLL